VGSTFLTAIVEEYIMAKEIVVSCENCGKKLKTEERYIGRKGRCPKCGSVIRLSRESDGEAKGTVEKVVERRDVEGTKDSLLEITMQDDVAVVSFRTSRILDQSNVQQLGDELDQLVEEHQFGKIVLNFNKIHYMSSAVMGKLVGLQKKVQSRGGELRLCNISSSIYEIFEIMRFDELFEICETEDDAVIDLLE
jgi:anti-anti-sigma factor